MALSHSPGNVGATTHGISDVINRNTEQDTPSQQWQFGASHPVWPPQQWSTDNLATRSHYPDPSSHWQQWFEQGGLNNWPTGRPQPFLINPDPTGLVSAVAGAQGTMHPGSSWMNQFLGDWSHSHNTATGK